MTSYVTPDPGRPGNFLIKPGPAPELTRQEAADIALAKGDVRESMRLKAEMLQAATQAADSQGHAYGADGRRMW